MIRASRVTIATLAVAGALTGGAWTLAGAAIPPESEPTAASIVSPTGPPRPDPDQELRDVTARLNSARQQLAAAQTQLQQHQDQVAASTTENTPSVTSPLADSTPPEDPAPQDPTPQDPTPENPAVETFPGQETAPVDLSSIAATPPVESPPPVAAEPRTRSGATGSTESSPAQVGDARSTSEHESGDRDD